MFTHIVHVFDTQNLLAQVLKVIEGRLRCDGVDEQEAHAVLHVQVSHRRELLLSARTICLLFTGFMSVTVAKYISTFWTVPFLGQVEMLSKTRENLQILKICYIIILMMPVYHYYIMSIMGRELFGTC